MARRFVEPSNSTHRQYEALRAFFVEEIPSAEAAARFGYTPGSFRVLRVITVIDAPSIKIIDGLPSL